MITRRNFVLGSAGLLIATTLSPVNALAGWAESEGLEEINEDLALKATNGLRLFPGVPLGGTKAKAIQLINSPFNIHYDDRNVLEVNLSDVVDKNGSSPEVDQYSLLFHTTWEHTPLKSGTYEMEQASLGKFQMFLSPLNSDEGGSYYEAIFNHVLDN